MSLQLDFIPPLEPGDIALRFRVEVRGDVFHPHRVVNGLQVVQVISVKDDFVTWTNGLKGRTGGDFRHTSHRRELISIGALESFGGNGAINRNGCASEPAATVAA